MLPDPLLYSFNRKFYFPLNQNNAVNLLKEEREFFSSMLTRKNLGEIIEMANKEATYEAKAQKFLALMRQSKE